jgi:CTP:molybdopterin cytidylyltransferase MocA
MLAAVILSGGASQRMGSPKALLPYQGRPFLEHLLDLTMHPKIGVRRIVLGLHAEPIAAAVRLAPGEIVVNDEWQLGQLSSIKAAIRSLPPNTDGLILFLVDNPLISAALVHDLIEQFYSSQNQSPQHQSPQHQSAQIHSAQNQSHQSQSALSQSAENQSPQSQSALNQSAQSQSPKNQSALNQSASKIVLPVFRGQRGHPVIFSADLYLELLNAPLEKGARAVVWAHGSEVAQVETTEQGCVLNLNDPETLQRVIG